MPSDSPLSFAKSLFFGAVRPELIRPFPRPSVEERETIEMLVESFRQWAAVHVDGAKFDAEHHVPREVRDGMAELGLFGLTVPEEHGGAGLGYTTYCRMLEEANRHCASTAVMFGGHQSIGMKAVLLRGSEEQKALWLPKLAAGEWIGAFALSEPEAGSDPAALSTTAVPTDDGEHYVLTGQKIWCTNGGFAEFITVFAKTPAELDGGQAGDWTISCFALTPEETGQDAFRRGPDEDKLGLRGSSTTQLFLDGVKVPAANLLGPRGQGLRVAFEVLNYGRMSLGAGCAGSQKAIAAHAWAHARDRVQFGRPIAEFEMVQEKLAEMAADIYATETISYLTAGLADRGDEDFSVEAAACKVFGTEACWRTCNHAVQIAGGIAYVREYPYERFLRDARINMIFEGTNEILHHFIAMTGLREPGKLAAGLGDEASRLGQGVLREKRGAPEPAFPGLPGALATAVEPLLASTAELGLAVERAIARHGRAIVERQLVQERLAAASIHIYVGFACAARAAEADGATAADELVIALHAIRRAADGAARALQALECNDDDVLIAAARAAATRGQWDLDLVP